MATRFPIIAAALLAIATPALAAPKPIVIKMDMGGSLSTYIARAERWSREGRKVIIDGDCRSACTYMLFTRYKMDVCVTMNARLMFHKPLKRTGPGRYDVATSPTLIAQSDEIWAGFLKEYPPKIAALVADAPNPAEIKDTRVYTIISGKELERLIPRC